MDAQNIDKKLLKAVVLELMNENRSLFKEIIEEILIENQVIISENQAERRKRVERIITKNFDKYDDVFKALA